MLNTKMLYNLKIITINHECSCMPSETYGRNGATLIFRSFHRTASSTTGGWSRIILQDLFLSVHTQIYIYLYIYLQVPFACVLCV